MMFTDIAVALVSQSNIIWPIDDLQDSVLCISLSC